MKALFFIFLSVFSIANSQNKRKDTAIMDPNLKIPEGYYRYKSKEISGICGMGYFSEPNAEYYDYDFYKKDNHIYCQNKLTNIDANGFQRLGLNYYKNNNNVYYYSIDLGLQKIPNADPNSLRILGSFLADKNFLYLKTLKIIRSQNLKLILDNIQYEEPPVKNTTERFFSPSNYYILKNNKGYWVIKSSTTIISYNFLGKMYDPKWEKIREENKYITDNDIYNSANVDTKPDYPGGIDEFYKFVQKEYRIPTEEGLKGKVYITFVVEKNGVLSGIRILRDIGYGTGEEFIRVLKLSKKWNPAIKNGRKVKCLYSIPYTVQQY